MLSRAFVITAALLLVAHSSITTAQDGRRTSAGSSSSVNPTINEEITKSCPAGTVLIGVTVDRVTGKQAVLRPRCRPIPTGSTNAWCNPSPPSGVNCTCDGFEKLAWERKNANGCWTCAGTGQACGAPAQCACVNGSGNSGAWMPQTCSQEDSIGQAINLSQRSASGDSCTYASDTQCTYQASPNSRCPGN